MTPALSFDKIYDSPFPETVYIPGEDEDRRDRYTWPEGSWLLPSRIFEILRRRHSVRAADPRPGYFDDYYISKTYTAPRGHTGVSLGNNSPGDRDITSVN